MPRDRHDSRGSSDDDSTDLDDENDPEVLSFLSFTFLAITAVKL